MLTTEQLLKPRYKVIADYPGCPWYLGRILTPISEYNWDCLEAPTMTGIQNPEKYPANFQPLPWWSDRKLEDMPEYVKVIKEDCSKDTGLFCKVHKWHLWEDKWPTLKGQLGAELEGYMPSYLARTELNSPGQVYGRLNATHLLPATLAEYEAYNQQKEGMK